MQPSIPTALPFAQDESLQHCHQLLQRSVHLPKRHARRVTPAVYLFTKFTKMSPPSPHYYRNTTGRKAAQALHMQRTLSRRRGAVAREDDSDSDDERFEATASSPSVVSDAAAAVCRAFSPSNEEFPPPTERSSPFLSLPPRLASSGSQLPLHSFDASAASSSGYTETKIGGHALDHRRPFLDDWRRALGGPVKTAVVGSISALFGSQARSSPAFDARKRDVLVYSSVKIAGHPMDHVPFINRGQPSRPLWGYVPNLNWPADARPIQVPVQAPQVSRMYQIEPNVLSNLYDCSRCLRLRQSPRVQLCCGHGLCASCVSSRSIKHVEHDRTCFLECVRCADLVAVEAVVFTNHVVRLQEPLARTVSELAEMSKASRDAAEDSKQSSLSRLGLAWKHGGVIAALSFLAGRLYPSGKTSRSSVKNWHGVRSPNKPAALRDVEAMVAPIPESVTRLLLDDVADLSKHLTPSTIDIIAKGADRWAKRVQGLKPPSKLLKFDFVRTLGVGNFAEVMLVRNRKGAYSVLKESDKLSEAVNEISILSRINNPNVVRIFQYFIEEVGHRHFAYIEMEYCDGGDLMQMLRDKVSWHILWVVGETGTRELTETQSCRALSSSPSSMRSSPNYALD